ncbi:carotenoid 1,2-hydratase [Desulfuromonas versatilis]|uniref:Carotenoid 1,2-hydratase n=1 Tax=Desulfuromonas versatilis TaxID=2802975 RepID=A0ABN6DTM2_9BACT|nr:lipocalin-like domain-containing protein [Desulfuromonas versatilis]BCR03477.1 carotenoid 1,2-hydratase [Desulfuromonas versatilis]
MSLRSWLILFALCLAALAALTQRAFHPAPPPADRERLNVAVALGGDAAEGYARALTPREFSFPSDHGPHPRYRTEWWYYTGNLQAADGRRFGYQLTFFRIALTPEPQPRASGWAANQLYMAHFALTDVAGRRFFHFERFARAALGLAGATTDPYRVWLEDWEASSDGSTALPMRLRAAQQRIAIDLHLESAKPVVLQGERGLSQKSPEEGNASYYYSLTRMPTVGRIEVGGESLAVAGDSWLDREWSTSALGPEQAGWDWFSLQLDDGRELMYYRLRKKDGSGDPMSSGTLVAGDGSYRRLRPQQVIIDEMGSWQSPHSGARYRYPSGWLLRLPGEGLELQITPMLRDQELQATVRYWEGAVVVEGTVGGQGYVELTGYGEE